MDAPWWTGSDTAPGLDADRDEARDRERWHCARCQQPLERVSISVYVPPFEQVLLACSDNCKADLEADLAGLADELARKRAEA